MRLITVSLATLCAAAFAPLATAAPAHVTDVAFIAANRCLGLESSKQLGSPDAAAALQRFVNAQSWGREGAVYDRADEARDDAIAEAGRGGTDHRARLVAERDGVCQSFLSTTSAAAAAPARSLQ
ncbi:MAG TPA: hypothetical protein VMU37_06885 [Caulobacteraceae bacterium]|nr:hypothetical protein [Caulobacteraceae bacterium]